MKPISNEIVKNNNLLNNPLNIQQQQKTTPFPREKTNIFSSLSEPAQNQIYINTYRPFPVEENPQNFHVVFAVNLRHLTFVEVKKKIVLLTEVVKTV